MKILSLITLVSILFVGNWVAPESAKNLKNPFQVTDQNVIKKGEKIFSQICWTCHGKTGIGDGPGGANLNPKPANFKATSFMAQTDGEIFWKLSEGKGVMPSYKGMFSEEQRWQLVTYIRSLGIKNK